MTVTPFLPGVPAATGAPSSAGSPGSSADGEDLGRPGGFLDALAAAMAGAMAGALAGAVGSVAPPVPAEVSGSAVRGVDVGASKSLVPGSEVATRLLGPAVAPADPTGTTTPPSTAAGATTVPPAAGTTAAPTVGVPVPTADPTTGAVLAEPALTSHLSEPTPPTGSPTRAAADESSTPESPTTVAAANGTNPAPAAARPALATKIHDSTDQNRQFDAPESTIQPATRADSTRQEVQLGAPIPTIRRDAAAVVRQVAPVVTQLVSRGNGTHRMTLTLQPEQLGEVRVTLVVRDGAVHVRLAADQAHDALAHGAPELRRLLELSGASEAKVVVRDLGTATASFSAQLGQHAGTQDRPAGQSGHPAAQSGTPGQAGDPDRRGSGESREQHDGREPRSAVRPGATPVAPTTPGRLDRTV